MKAQVTMAEIASHLSVSPSTVSRALRGDKRISTARRAEIKAAAKALGYRPNPLVSALMKSRHSKDMSQHASTIALVTDYRSKEGWEEKDVCLWEYRGMVSRASEMGFKLEEFSLLDYGGDTTKLQKTLSTRGIKGVLLGFSRNSGPRTPFSTEEFAVAGLSAYFRKILVDRSNFHGLYNVRIAFDEIRKKGYQKVGLVVPEFNNRISGYLWSGGALDWQRQLPAHQQCRAFIAESEDCKEEFLEWVQTERPGALLVYKLPVEAWLREIGLAVPRDIGLAFLFRSEEERKHAAGIDGNLSQVGATAVDLVISNLYTNQYGLPTSPKEVLVKGKWQDGATLPGRHTVDL